MGEWRLQPKVHFFVFIAKTILIFYHNTVKVFLVCALSAIQMQDRDPILVSERLKPQSKTVWRKCTWKGWTFADQWGGKWLPCQLSKCITGRFNSREQDGQEEFYKELFLLWGLSYNERGAFKKKLEEPNTAYRNPIFPT